MRQSSNSLIYFPVFSIFRRKGFSLVEVTLALGLCAFTLVALLGLLPVALNSARSATEISRSAKAIEHMASELSQSRFTNVVGMANQTRYFDYDGLVTTNTNDAYFTVRATIVPDAGLLPGTPQTGVHQARVTFEVDTRSQTNAARASLVIADLGY